MRFSVWVGGCTGYEKEFYSLERDSNNEKLSRADELEFWKLELVYHIYEFNNADADQEAIPTRHGVLHVSMDSISSRALMSVKTSFLRPILGTVMNGVGA